MSQVQADEQSVARRRFRNGHHWDSTHSRNPCPKRQYSKYFSRWRLNASVPARHDFSTALRYADQTLAVNPYSEGGLAIRTGQVVWSNDTTTDPRADKDAGQRISVGSAICVPLVRGKSTFGVLTATSPHTFAFTEADVATLTGLAESLSADVASARTPPPLANT